MSSRSIGVTKVELRRLMMSWVIRSPSCSALRISRASPPSSGQVPIIWSSRRAAWRVFCPASMKRSKKVRSRGRRERRATRAILVIGVGAERLSRVAAASCSAARAAWRSRSSSWTLRRCPPAAARAGSRRRRRRAPRRWRCRRSSAPARRAARPAAPASSTGVTSSTRLSRLRGIRSAEPISTRVSSPRWKA